MLVVNQDCAEDIPFGRDHTGVGHLSREKWAACPVKKITIGLEVVWRTVSSVCLLDVAQGLGRASDV